MSVSGEVKTSGGDDSMMEHGRFSIYFRRGE